MKRREALKRTTLILGYAVSASAISGVLSGCINDSASSSSKSTTGVRSDSIENWKPEFFSQKEIDLIAELCETILPETDTPGAKTVNVHRYIDIMLKGHYEPENQKAFRQGLIGIDKDCVEIFGHKFVGCTSENRLKYLIDVEKRTKAMIENEENEPGVRPYFAILKELTWIGFFTSELIGEKYLNYDPIPGAYHGCIPLDEADSRSWSL